MESTNVDTFDKLSLILTEIDSNRLSVEVYYKDGLVSELLGLLYYEKAKRGFINKPIGLDKWVCVDAKVEGLYTRDKAITPPMIVQMGYDKIKDAGY
jgi:hypothetical protein